MHYRESDSFVRLQKWFFESTGIQFNDSKRPLVNSRLQKRVRLLQLTSLDQYINLLEVDSKEQQVAINLLTTNETYFFRELKHYQYLENEILPLLSKQEKMLIWSAASSSGEEAYSTALLLANNVGLFKQWQVHGTDINTQVLDIAKRGVYPIDSSAKITEDLLKQFCMKGKGKDAGFFMIRPDIKEHVAFQQTNLLAPKPISTSYDVIFLRNVLIYFNSQEKAAILSNVLKFLRAGGWLFVGHSETVTGIDERLQQIKPGIYRLKTA